MLSFSKVKLLSTKLILSSTSVVNLLLQLEVINFEVEAIEDWVTVLSEPGEELPSAQDDSACSFKLSKKLLIWFFSIKKNLKYLNLPF